MIHKLFWASDFYNTMLQIYNIEIFNFNFGFKIISKYTNVMQILQLPIGDLKGDRLSLYGPQTIIVIVKL